MKNQEMVTVCLHPLPLKTKNEASANVGKITNELPYCVRTLSFNSFVRKIGLGHTWSGAQFEPKVKKAANWKCQQVFAIDIDNNDGKNIPPKVLYKHYEKKGYPPNACYFSLSSKPEQLKYRLLWMTKDTVVDPLVAENFKRWLIKNSKNLADSCTINLDRLYYGGKFGKIYHYDQIIEIPQSERKAFRKERRKIEENVLDISSFVPDILKVHKCMADPFEFYGTRYKCYFNCAIALTRGSTGTWLPDQIYQYLSELRDRSPSIWSNYHHSEEDLYKYTEAAYNWAMDEL